VLASTLIIAKFVDPDDGRLGKAHKNVFVVVHHRSEGCATVGKL
jgi:hypothetical protein